MRQFIFRALLQAESDRFGRTGDASFLPVANSPRSYVLKFASSDARHFYWCQDPDSSKDEERAGIINSLIQDSMNEDVAMEG